MERQRVNLYNKFFNAAGNCLHANLLVPFLKGYFLPGRIHGHNWFPGWKWYSVYQFPPSYDPRSIKRESPGGPQRRGPTSPLLGFGLNCPPFPEGEHLLGPPGFNRNRPPPPPGRGVFVYMGGFFRFPPLNYKRVALRFV